MNRLIGALARGLRAFGKFLPLLQTTCLVLPGAWVFAKSSPTAHAWLCSTSPFAQPRRDWQRYRVIHHTARWTAGLCDLCPSRFP